MCICGDYAPESLELRVPQLCCPGCRLWPAITWRVRAGELLFANWAARRALEELRFFAEARGVKKWGEDGHAFSSKRSSPSNSGSWGSCSQPPQSGPWRSPAYRLYLNPSRDESWTLAAVLIEASGEDHKLDSTEELLEASRYVESQH